VKPAFPLFRVAAAGLMALAALGPRGLAQEGPLRSAAAVQQLAAEEARQSREVRLRGVVTFTWHTGTTEFTLEDDTGAIWCPAVALPFDCRVGTEVEIEGRTDAGILGPFVHAVTVRALGPRALGAPPRPTFQELLAAPLHGRRVEIEGIVRGQRVNPELGLDWLALEVVTGGGRITVNVTHEATGHPELIDSLVRVRGVNLHATDAQQQAFLPMINAHTLADVTVLTPANPHPFEQPPTPLARIMRSSSVAGAGHRLRVRGVVTYVSGGDAFFLEDESRGLQVFAREALLPLPGEAVDVVGFPEPGAFSPVLRDADWRPSGPGARPNPPRVTVTEAAKYDGRLIAIEGRLTEWAPRGNEVELTLEQEGRRCRVYVPKPRGGAWSEGAVLRATGVCSVEIGDWESFVAHRRPTGFSLLVQGPDAITVVRAAPWWNLTRITWLLAGAAGALGCALGVVWWQAKQRLRETARTREAAQAQFVAVLAERNRIAREIHDTLAQGFAGISAQLEVLHDRLHDAPAGLRRHLDLARDLVRSSLGEARRSVWNLRARALEEEGLDGALRRLGQQLTSDGKIAFALTVAGTPRALPVDVENNLLRIGQEAITNAVRHAAPGRIEVSLEYLADEVRLAISDNGRGLAPPAAATPSARGGFGLPGMRERAEAMHAAFELAPAPDGGTRLSILVPHV
jgi:signal transduction histidine kinase